MEPIKASFFFFVFFLAVTLAGSAQDDAKLTTIQLITKYGYPAESHKVMTEDGYYLTMHRIPYGRKANAKTKRPVVFLQHCIMCSSAVFVLTGPGKGLGFILADKGYDVWMGNARGTKYSKGHRNRHMRSARYWEFSWHEMGVYDLPAEIDYVISHTNQSKIFYTGHSMGTTMMFVLLSEKPEYNSKIRLFVALSPVAYMSHMRSLVFRIVYGPLASLMKTFGFQEFVPHNGIISVMSRIMCENKAMSSLICTNAMFLISGYDSEQMNVTMLPVIVGHIPAGTSISSLVHYGQNMINGDFRKFDVGKTMNRRRYGSAVPPSYNISKITAPVAFYRGNNDWLSDPVDVQRLSDQIPNLVHNYNVPLPAFNHMDFLFAKDAYKLLYKNVLEILKKF
ncbi:lipase 3-like [Cimex lectularius]|uniref:Lipase n=1 Tax=Cimex lectularius TaxID=79782 RepID=A0A8I6RW25_CIMLE|nr:lipase 3-like [Cimex lectularius]